MVSKAHGIRCSLVPNARITSALEMASMAAWRQMGGFRF